MVKMEYHTPEIYIVIWSTMFGIDYNFDLLKLPKWFKIWKMTFKQNICV